MGIFVKKTCIGLTWDASGACYGVHVRRSGGSVRIVQVWRSDPRPEEPLSSQLSRAPVELGAVESTVVVAGSSEPVAGLVDLGLPPLAPADQRSALAFELNRHAPIPTDRLVWGHRVLEHNGNGRSLFRLVYLRETDWNRWIEAVGSLPRGVDAILPPAAALDPVLAGRAIQLGTGVSEIGFVYAPAGDGSREIRLPGPDDTDSADPETALFGLDELDSGPLGDDSPANRRLFAPALVLALYGLTRNAVQDQKTWAPIPYELRPRRNQGSRIVAAALFLYMLAGVGVLLARQYSRGMEELNALRARSTELQAKLSEIQVPKTDDKLFDAIKKDLEGALVDRPTLTEALIELTRLIDKSAWVTSLTWTDGKIDLQVRTAEDNPDIFVKLRESPIFQDVVPLGSTVDHRTNETTLRFQMRATFRLNSTRPEGTQKPKFAPGPSAANPGAPPSAPGSKGVVGAVPPPPPPPGTVPAVATPGKTLVRELGGAHAFPGAGGRSRAVAPGAVPDKPGPRKGK